MPIGYARVSKHEQNLDLQRDALKQAGCKKIYVDEITGKHLNRDGLDKALDQLREGDTLVVWRLDRLARSLKHLIELLTHLEERQHGKLIAEKTMFPFPIGKTDIHETQVTLDPDYLRRHVAIFGKSGVGKSTLLLNLAAWIIHEGHGATVIDPHGELIDTILGLIPKDRIGDVIFFDPTDRALWRLQRHTPRACNPYQPCQLRQTPR